MLDFCLLTFALILEHIGYSIVILPASEALRGAPDRSDPPLSPKVPAMRDILVWATPSSRVRAST